MKKNSRTKQQKYGGGKMNSDDLQKISGNNMDIDTETLGMMIRLINALDN